MKQFDKNRDYYFDFLVEVQAKNEAYAFILAYGMFDEFRKFSSHYRNGIDYHEATVSMLMLEGDESESGQDK